MIARLRACGQWNPELAKRFATTWGLHRETVKSMAKEAGRWLNLDKETIVEFCRVGLMTLAVEKQSEQAYRILLEHFGELWQRQHHVVTRKAEKFAGWTEAELEEYSRTGKRPARVNATLKGMNGTRRSMNGGNGAHGGTGPFLDDDEAPEEPRH